MEIGWHIPGWAWPLLLAAIAGAWFWSIRNYRATDPPLAANLRRRLLALRLAAVTLLLIAVARPVVSRFAAENLAPVIAIIVEDSGSMSIPDVASAAAATAGSSASDTTAAPALTRWEVATQFATALAQVGERRAERPEIALLRGNGLVPLRSYAGAALPPPTAVGSDLNGLVRQIGDLFAGRPLRAVIVLADGNDTATPSARGLPTVRATDGLGGTAPLVRVVGFGDPVGPADRMLRDLRYPDVAYAGDEVLIELAVTDHDAAAAVKQPVTVRLREDDRLVAEATSSAADDLVRLELAFKPETADLHVYELEVSPLVNERYLANNRTTLAVNVRKERARLVALAAQPGWDVRFLAAAAAREERLQLDVVYRGPDGFILADSAAAWQPPTGAAGWQQWDGVILAGWQGWLDNQLLAPLAEAVENGLGLWVLPGPAERATRAVAGRTQVSLPPPLAAVVPIAADALRLEERGEWFVAETAAGAGHPVLAGVADDVGGATLANLPPLVSVVAARPRADAVVLLRARPARRDSLGVPLLVLGQPGQGRVAWFGGRRLWELAFWELPAAARGGGEQPARRLVQNLLVWVATGGQDAGLALVGHRRVYREGEPIRLEARWHDMRGAPVTGQPLVIRVAAAEPDSGEVVRDHTARPLPGRPGHAEVELPPLPPGRYTVQPRSTEQPPTVGPPESLVVTANSLEQSQVRQDTRRLRRLAAAWDGSYLAAADSVATTRLLTELAEVALPGQERRIRRRWDFWAGWPLLVAATLLLGSEWFLRRRHGLL